MKSSMHLHHHQNCTYCHNSVQGKVALTWLLSSTSPLLQLMPHTARCLSCRSCVKPSSPFCVSLLQPPSISSRRPVMPANTLLTAASVMASPLPAMHKLLRQRSDSSTVMLPSGHSESTMLKRLRLGQLLVKRVRLLHGTALNRAVVLCAKL
jgi:hypothetical protein